MNLELIVLSDTFAICRLDADAPIPKSAPGEFVSVTRTTDELSIVCLQDDVPDGVQFEGGWRCLRVAGKLEFSMIGVIASLTGALAKAGVSVFVISTFDTDFMLVNEKNLEKATAAIEEAGHRVAGVQ